MPSSKQTNKFSRLALFKKSTHPQSTWDMDSFRSLGGSHQQAQKFSTSNSKRYLIFWATLAFLDFGIEMVCPQKV